MELLNPLSKPAAVEIFVEVSRFRTDIPLIGLKDGDNQVFQVGPGGTPEVFIHIPDGLSIEVYHNNVKLTRGYHFDVEESGGVGAGYDTIRFLKFTPAHPKQLHTHSLKATYVAAPD